MRISDVLRRGRSISFEFFPPRTDEADLGRGVLAQTGDDRGLDPAPDETHPHAQAPRQRSSRPFAVGNDGCAV